MKIKIGTRGSKLALWQANWAKNAIEDLDSSISVDLIIIKTKGDKILDVPLAKVGGKGLFVKEIEAALLDERIDLAVHSMKDMPAEIPEGLMIGAVPQRESPRDALISKDGHGLSELQTKATIGTSSLRRAAQIKQIRSDLAVKPLRGNMDTRLSKLDHGEYNAIVLAEAGLKRLNLHHRVSQALDAQDFIPAVGQGALCLEIRESDNEMRGLVEKLNHIETHMAVTCERAFLKELEGGCQVPIAGHATICGDKITMQGMVSDVDGKDMMKIQSSGLKTQAFEIGLNLAQRFLKCGAGEILAQLSKETDR